MSSAEETAVTDPAAPALDERREAMVATLTEHLGDAVVATQLLPGARDPWVRVARDAWRDAASVAREVLRCRFFDFLSAVDWMASPYGRYEDAVVDTGSPRREEVELVARGHAGGDTRFQLLAHVVDVTGYRGVFLKADLPDGDLRAPSVVPVYAGADWHERETWEMFGIAFDGHPGLRHLYLPSAFEGHPLRKDFPLLSRIVKPWPGIVDVEPMPGEAPDEAGDDAGDGAGGDG